MHCPHIEKNENAKPVGAADDAANDRRELIKDDLFQKMDAEGLKAMQARAALNDV